MMSYDASKCKWVISAIFQHWLFLPVNSAMIRYLVPSVTFDFLILFEYWIHDLVYMVSNAYIYVGSDIICARYASVSIALLRKDCVYYCFTVPTCNKVFLLFLRLLLLC